MHPVQVEEGMRQVRWPRCGEEQQPAAPYRGHLSPKPVRLTPDDSPPDPGSLWHGLVHSHQGHQVLNWSFSSLTSSPSLMSSSLAILLQLALTKDSEKITIAKKWNDVSMKVFLIRCRCFQQETLRCGDQNLIFLSTSATSATNVNVDNDVGVDDKVDQKSGKKV